MAAAQGTFQLVDVGHDVVRLIAEYVPADDLQSLRASSRALRHDVPRVVSTPALEHRTRSYGREEWFRFPPLAAHATSIRVAGRWRDQGWGNRKGAIGLLLLRGPELERVADARNVTNKVAEHGWEDLDVTLRADDHPLVRETRAGDVLVVTSIAGGGGGHELFVEGMRFFLTLQADR